jgi:hypothetical protein
MFSEKRARPPFALVRVQDEAQVGLRKGDFSSAQFPRTGVLAGIEIHTRASVTLWALEMLPSENAAPVRIGEAALPLDIGKLQSDVRGARDLFERALAENRQALRDGDMSIASFPRIGDDAKVELETRVSVLTWVLEMVPTPPEIPREDESVGHSPGLREDHEAAAMDDEGQFVPAPQG